MRMVCRCRACTGRNWRRGEKCWQLSICFSFSTTQRIEPLSQRVEHCIAFDRPATPQPRRWSAVANCSKMGTDKVRGCVTAGCTCNARQASVWCERCWVAERAQFLHLSPAPMPQARTPSPPKSRPTCQKRRRNSYTYKQHSPSLVSLNGPSPASVTSQSHLLQAPSEGTGDSDYVILANALQEFGLHGDRTATNSSAGHSPVDSLSQTIRESVSMASPPKFSKASLSRMYYSTVLADTTGYPCSRSAPTSPSN